jgi:hypothetical protein
MKGEMKLGKKIIKKIYISSDYISLLPLVPSAGINESYKKLKINNFKMT